MAVDGIQKMQQFQKSIILIYDDIQNACKDIIFERLTTTPITELLSFYIEKYWVQWSEGDLSGVFWSQLNVREEDIIIKFDKGGKEIFQVIYALIIVLVFIGLFNKKRFKDNSEINLFYIIFLWIWSCLFDNRNAIKIFIYSMLAIYYFSCFWCWEK